MPDQNGRPDYPQPPDLQPRLDEKRLALDARLVLINEQDAAELARFQPAPAPKGKKK